MSRYFLNSQAPARSSRLLTPVLIGLTAAFALGGSGSAQTGSEPVELPATGNPTPLFPVLVLPLPVPTPPTLLTAPEAAPQPTPTTAPFIGPTLPPLLPPAPPIIGPVLPPVVPVTPAPVPANPLPTTPPVTPIPINPVPSSPTPSNPVPINPVPTLPAPNPTSVSSVRGLWVDAFGPGLKTPAQVAQMVKDAHDLGINTLFVQTIRRADCLCSRSSVPRATDADLAPGFDPLAEVLRLAHAQGIRVFAWVSVTGAGNAAAPNLNPQHVLKLHGPAAGLNSWVNRRPDGSYLEGSDIWLDAGIPQAADYMAQSILSVVKNYDIDGIQLDRIRYPDGGMWGYSSAALARYRSETGNKGTPLPSDPTWINWKREQITALVRRIVLETRRLKPNVWTSAATITYGAPPADLSGFEKSRTYSDVLQNWPAWTQEGLIDLNVLMNYKQDLVPNHTQWFDDWNKFALSVRGKAEVAAGTALYLNSPDVSRNQMQRALSAGLGWVGYAYRTPGVDVYKNGQSQPRGFEVLRKSLTQNGGPLTATPWKLSPPVHSGVLGRVISSSDMGGKVVEARSAGGTLLGKTTTDGNGYYGFTDLPLGAVEVRVAGQRWQGQLTQAGVARYPDLLLKGTQIIPALKSRP
ncbi:family 10 glycosylhydrolase [Deinococcus psychrotolerans]|uniref:family 10 glycosylhydrolase n=1 Tax=Deinococcus psychrotolerans TaxID=2489213 RepID=UPI001F14AF72|nr:family 10 glycosylhydrolase [Deinococcus psychrotolerans]